MDIEQQRHWVLTFAGMTSLETMGYNQLPYLRI